MHELQILERFEGHEAAKALANASSNPSIRTLKHLFHKLRYFIKIYYYKSILTPNFLRLAKYGDKTKENVVELLHKKKAELSEKGYSLEFTAEPLNIALVSPLMRRAHKQKFAEENVFVDSTASCDEVTFFQTIRERNN